MPLASSAVLAPHFTAAELGADQPEATAAVVANLQRVATWLEQLRELLGEPLRVTSGFRTAAHNAEIGGSASSDHVTGLAADVEAQSLSPFQVYQRLRVAQDRRALPPFDQLIYYALDNHLHVGLGTRMRGEVLLKTTEGSYVALAGSYVSRLRGYL